MLDVLERINTEKHWKPQQKKTELMLIIFVTKPLKLEPVLHLLLNKRGQWNIENSFYCGIHSSRSLVANLGAANKYSKDHFDSAEIQAKLNNAKFLYSAGFFLTVSTDTLIDIGKHAVENNKVNYSSSFFYWFSFLF